MYPARTSLSATACGNGTSASRTRYSGADTTVTAAPAAAGAAAATHPGASTVASSRVHAGSHGRSPTHAPAAPRGSSCRITCLASCDAVDRVTTSTDDETSTGDDSTMRARPKRTSKPPPPPPPPPPPAPPRVYPDAASTRAEGTTASTVIATSIAGPGRQPGATTRAARPIVLPEGTRRSTMGTLGAAGRSDQRLPSAAHVTCSAHTSVTIKHRMETPN